MSEIIKRGTLSEEKKQALQGMGIFVKVSRDTPASVFRQAAGIVLFCQQRNLDPFLLEQSLVKDQELLEKIGNIGKRAHEASGNKLAMSMEMKPSKVYNIVIASFGNAREMMGLTTQDLGGIIRSNIKFEYSLKVEVDQLIALRERERRDRPCPKDNHQSLHNFP